MTTTEGQTPLTADPPAYGTEVVVDRDDAGSPASNDDKGAMMLLAVQSVMRVRITYGILIVVAFIIGLLLQQNIITWFTSWAIGDGCNGEETCIGNQGVYRVSFTLFVFFLFHWVMSSSWNLCMEPPMRVKFNQAGVWIKLIFLVPILILAFIIPNNFFVVFAWFSLILSMIFLIGQLLVLLEFAYSWSDNWAAREEPKFLVGLLVCAVFMIVASLTMIGLGYKWFGSSKECQLQQAMISITLICSLLYFPLAIWVPHGSILPAATVMIYTTWTCFSALSAGPGGACNEIHTTGLMSVIISAVFSCVSLVSTTISAGTSRGAFVLEDKEETVEEAEAACFSFFHLQMMLGSCYLSMLLSNWAIQGATSPNLHTFAGTAEGPMWAKFVSLLLCVVLFVWTLLAPKICPDRFGTGDVSPSEALE